MGIGLGIDSGYLFEKNIEEETLKLAANEIFLLYTDGIVEAMNNNNEMFGEEHLLEILRKNQKNDVAAIKNDILNELTTFLDGRMVQDDITMVILKNKKGQS
jgi:sigma-B regulation protein RsbU (phosphoserine phosphatase)